MSTSEDHSTDEPMPKETKAGFSQLSLFADLGMEDAQAPLAICTLMSDELREDLQTETELQGVLVGGLKTENIGIEQIITYVLSNPAIRYIVLCGEDGKQAIGQLPGQSFLSLGQNGLDDKGKIIGALGKRPIIQNLPKGGADHFREHVTLIDLVGCTDKARIMTQVRNLLAEKPEPAPSFYNADTTTIIEGYIHHDMQMDPRGYFIVSIDDEQGCLVLEHYNNKGILENIIEGYTASELFTPAIDKGLVSRMDHTAYLGKELSKAEVALLTGVPYVQDEPLQG